LADEVFRLSVEHSIITPAELVSMLAEVTEQPFAVVAACAATFEWVVVSRSGLTLLAPVTARRRAAPAAHADRAAALVVPLCRGRWVRDALGSPRVRGAGEPLHARTEPRRESHSAA
jgi:hypothetical protein